MCLYIYDVTLLWKLHAMKSFWMISCMKVEDARGAFGDCVRQVLIYGQTHFFKKLPVETCLQHVVCELHIHMTDKLDFISSAVTLISGLCYVIFNYTFLQKECECLCFVGPRSYFTGSTSGARVASHYTAVG